MGTHRLATHRTTVIMKFFALLSATLAAASAQYPVPVGYAGLGYAHGAYAAGYGSYGVAPAAYHAAAPLAVAAAPAVAVAPAPVAVAPIAPEVTSSQYRAEDEAGNTAYGYRVIGRTRRSAQVAPVAFAAAPAAPAREAVLTTIKLNPGHA